MPIQTTIDRQYTQSAVLKFGVGGFTDGNVQPALQLPAGCIITGGFVVVTTAFNAGTSATLKIGDVADDDRYTQTPINLAAVGKTDIVPTGYELLQIGNLQFTYTGSGAAATQGAATLVLHYVDSGKGDFIEGYN